MPFLLDKIALFETCLCSLPDASENDSAHRPIGLQIDYLSTFRTYITYANVNPKAAIRFVAVHCHRCRHNFSVPRLQPVGFNWYEIETNNCFFVSLFGFPHFGGV